MGAVARKLWPRKTAAELASRTGRSQRQCHYYLARKFNLDAPALVRLLRSREGLAFLEAMLGDDKPEWFQDFKENVEIRRLRRSQAEIRKRIEAFSGD